MSIRVQGAVVQEQGLTFAVVVVKKQVMDNPFDPQWKSYFKERAFYRKFASIATKPGLNRRETGSAHAGLCSGLSRMRRKSHVRF